jgi:hypothetical protein
MREKSNSDNDNNNDGKHKPTNFGRLHDLSARRPMKSPTTTDKQQEDLDLPYLTSHQQDLVATPTGAAHQDQQLAQLDVPSAGLKNDSNNNSSSNNNKTATRLVSNLKGSKQQQLDSSEPVGGAQAARAQTATTTTTTAAASIAAANSGSQTVSSPILVSKSASSSSVLSSVSLASGAQMKPANQIIAAGAQVVAGGALPAEQKPPAEQRVAGDEDERRADLNDAQRLAAAADRKASGAGQHRDHDEDDISKASSDKTPVRPDEVSKTRQCAGGATSQLVAHDPQIQTPQPKIRELKQLLRHTNSLNQLPDYGVETQSEAELGALMDQIDVWGLNIFEVHKYSQEHSLTAVMYKIFKVSGAAAAAAALRPVPSARQSCSPTTVTFTC